MVKLDYKSGKPLHEQITAELKELVISGALKTDEQLPSVRELSVSLTVNPNTVQRAYKTLEQEGIIYSIRGKGNFVAKVPEASDRQIAGLYETLADTLKELIFWGESREKINRVVNRLFDEGKEKHD